MCVTVKEGVQEQYWVWITAPESRTQVMSRVKEKELSSWTDPPCPSLSLQLCMWKGMKKRLKVP